MKKKWYLLFISIFFGVSSLGCNVNSFHVDLGEEILRQSETFLASRGWDRATLPSLTVDALQTSEAELICKMRGFNRLRSFEIEMIPPETQISYIYPENGTDLLYLYQFNYDPRLDEFRGHRSRRFRSIRCSTPAPVREPQPDELLDHLQQAFADAASDLNWQEYRFLELYQLEQEASSFLENREQEQSLRRLRLQWLQTHIRETQRYILREESPMEMSSLSLLPTPHSEVSSSSTDSVLEHFQSLFTETEVQSPGQRISTALQEAPLFIDPPEILRPLTIHEPQPRQQTYLRTLWNFLDPLPVLFGAIENPGSILIEDIDD